MQALDFKVLVFRNLVNLQQLCIHKFKKINKDQTVMGSKCLNLLRMNLGRFNNNFLAGDEGV